MFVYSGDFIKTLGIWDVIKDACDKLGIDFQECGEVVPNPKIELIRDLVKVCKEHKTDFVLAAGGWKFCRYSKIHRTWYSLRWRCLGFL